MRTLLQTLGETFALEDPVDGGSLVSTPFVYASAIHSDAGLTRSLAGITVITRDMGFSAHAETVYSEDGQSAAYQAVHVSEPAAIVVTCCPCRQTVCLAVAGADSAQAYALFLEADARLFGEC